MNRKKRCQNCWFGLLRPNGCHQKTAVWFAPPPFLRVPLQLNTISLVPHFTISGFGQSTESKGSPEFPNSLLSLHIIIGHLVPPKDEKYSAPCNAVTCSFSVQCLAPGQRPMKLRVELSCSSLHSFFSNGKTARWRALQYLRILDRSQQGKWVTESVL